MAPAGDRSAARDGRRRRAQLGRRDRQPRTRRPVAAKTALATAGATSGTGCSPYPPGAAPLSRITRLERAASGRSAAPRSRRRCPERPVPRKSILPSSVADSPQVMPLSVWPSMPRGLSAMPQSTAVTMRRRAGRRGLGDARLRRPSRGSCRRGTRWPRRRGRAGARRRRQRPRSQPARSRRRLEHARQPAAVDRVGPDLSSRRRQQLQSKRDRILAGRERQLVEKRFAPEHGRRVLDRAPRTRRAPGS